MVHYFMLFYKGFGAGIPATADYDSWTLTLTIDGAEHKLDLHHALRMLESPLVEHLPLRDTELPGKEKTGLDIHRVDG